jgi:hypothetical protein
VAQYGLRIMVTASVETGAARFRMVLLDGATGRLGSLDIPIGGTGEKK